MKSVSVFLQSILGIKNSDPGDPVERRRRNSNLRENKPPDNRTRTNNDLDLGQDAKTSKPMDVNEAAGSSNSPITIFSPESSVVYLLHKKASKGSPSLSRATESASTDTTPVQSIPGNRGIYPEKIITAENTKLSQTADELVLIGHTRPNNTR
jgi:hypothetical protein